jgi:hypothetical protein
LSVQEGAAHDPALHTLDAQSVPAPQAPPVPQAGQGPPQSISVSVPFFNPSVHEGTPQEPAAQTFELQSA